MIDLEREADETELAFMQAARNIRSVEDEERVKELCHEYLNVLKRLKHGVLETPIFEMGLKRLPKTFKALRTQ